MNKLLFFFATVLMFLNSINIQAQNNPLDKYEYIIVPIKFAFQNEPHEYNINNILKSSFETNNFKAFIKSEKIDTSIDPCSVLTVDLLKTGILSNKMKFIFNDCYGTPIYTSTEGVSRLKEHPSSHYDAIRKALHDPNIKGHVYNHDKEKIVNTIIKKDINTTLHKFDLKLREKQYTFIEISTTKYDIYLIDQHVGTAKKEQHSKLFKVETKHLNGTGYFDDFGNFIISRKNPINNKIIKDILERIN